MFRTNAQQVPRHAGFSSGRLPKQWLAADALRDSVRTRCFSTHQRSDGTLARQRRQSSLTQEIGLVGHLREARECLGSIFTCWVDFHPMTRPQAFRSGHLRSNRLGQAARTAPQDLVADREGFDLAAGEKPLQRDLGHDRRFGQPGPADPLAVDALHRIRALRALGQVDANGVLGKFNQLLVHRRRFRRGCVAKSRFENIALVA